MGRPRLGAFFARRGGSRPAGSGGRSARTSGRTLVTPPSVNAACRPDPVLRCTHVELAPGGDFAATAVPNGRLCSDMVPAHGASWEAVEEFALTYDGYAYWTDVAELAKRSLERWTREHRLVSTLDELRGCLFYEQRRWHHFGGEPQERAAEYVRALLEAIRVLVGSRDVVSVSATLPAPATAPAPTRAPALPHGPDAAGDMGQADAPQVTGPGQHGSAGEHAPSAEAATRRRAV